MEIEGASRRWTTHEHPALHWQLLPHLQLGFPHPDIVQGWLDGRTSRGREGCDAMEENCDGAGEAGRLENEESGGRKRALYSHSLCVYGQAGQLIGGVADGCDDRHSHRIDDGGQTRHSPL